MYTQVFLRVQFLALYFSPCILSLCLPLLTHTIIYHSFADDLQLQMSAPPDRISELVHSMQSCISDVKAWPTANTLKLNDSKTELMLVTSKRSKHLHNLPTSITIGNVQIPFKQSVKNVGFTLDCHLTMNAHVPNIARTCYFELRRLASIRRFLTSTATIGVVVRMSILDTKVDGSNPSINMFSPSARDFIHIASVDSAVKWVQGGDNLVKVVQCYELFVGIALKIHTFSFSSTATATLVSAFVLSRIDYCNSLLFCSTHDVTSHLQRIQNYAARVILRLPKSSSITIHLK